MSGFVYAIQNRGSGLVKIGVAVNLERRLAQLQCQSGMPLELLASARHELPRLTEEHLHRLFAGERELGEWFRLSVDQIADLPDLLEMGVDAPKEKPGIHWRLRELLKREGVSVMGLADAMPGETRPSSRRTQLYTITSPDPEKRPKGLDFEFLNAILEGLRSLKGREFAVTELLEYTPDEVAQ